MIALWGVYWALAPVLYIQENGLDNARKGALGLAMVTLRGLAFLWLALSLVRRRFSDIPMIAIMLVPLCLTDVISAVNQAAPVADSFGLLVVSMLSLSIVLGMCALVWRLDRRAPPA